MASSIVAPKRPLITLPFLLPSCTKQLAPASQRYQSSYRRTKLHLRVKPDASFGKSDVKQDHIIYNPPSSAPSVYHTPTKFLPSNDVRRTMRTATAPIDVNTLPNLRTRENKTPQYNLTPGEIEEIRSLRLSDPMIWSRQRLAKRFNCSPYFVAMVCEASKEKKEIQKQVLEAVQSQWGQKRRMAREDRQLRKESWGRDE